MNLPRLLFLTLTTAVPFGIAPAPLHANDRASLEFFEKKIRPVLAEQCYRCHSAEAEKLKAGLQVDHLQHLLTGGDSGPALVAGKPAESLLIESIRYGNPDLQMPPKTRLDDAVIADFEKWVAMGAPWPAEPTTPLHGSGGKVDGTEMVMEAFNLEKRRAEHWCWQPIARPGFPAVKQADWPLAGLDRFILAKLEQEDLRPAEPAAPANWLRRVHFDLIGLPPTTEQLDAFLAEKNAHPDSDVAERNVVESLLASPHFGERWARHWMDLARYGESCGHEFDYAIPHAWRYRDYLIDAFNRDLPYDQFVIEHLAGDLLENPRRHPDDGTNASLPATGFWFLHEAVHAPTDIRGDEAGRIDNQIDVFGKSFLGLTVACARCHDHKFDAISTADYYAMAGYLQSSRRQEAFLDPHGKIAGAATEARALRDRGQELLNRAFAGAGDDAGKTMARYVSAAGRMIEEMKNRQPDGTGELVFEDFEADYGDWKIEGEAFGKSPAPGALAGHQKISGFLGKGLVNTYLKSDTPTGRALSPEFKIERPFIHFLIGGGAHEKQTCLNLLIDGKPVRTATGKNSDALAAATWDVSDLAGKTARLEIVDAATGGWGHVDIDHIVFSEHAQPSFDPATRPIDRALLSRVASEEGSLDQATLLNHAERLRRGDTGFANVADPPLPEDATMLADFTNGDAQGWTATGEAFDPTPTTEPSWAPGSGGGLLAPAGVMSSAGLPEKFEGVLRSPTFKLTGDHLHLRINARHAQVRLVIDGHYMNRFHTLLLKGTILKNIDTEGEFRWLTMTGDLDKYVGHRVWLEVSDVDGGHVMIDQVVVSNESLPPAPAVESPALELRWQQALAAFENGNPSNADIELLNLVWREGLWPKHPDLDRLAKNLQSIAVESPIEVTALLDGTPENEHVHIRGSHLKLGDEIPRRNLEALGGTPAPEDASGRLQLARELVAGDNPLVRRVIVNRVWHHLFGRGLVATVDDFGVMGQPPSHPELLDHLASEFSDTHRWSIKSLLGEIVLSRTYRMSSAPHPDLDPDQLAVIDPENVLLHRAPVRRLQAEAIRDAILTVSGRLDPAVGGGSVPVHLTAFMEGRGRPGQSGPLDGAGRRSLYAEIRRNFLPPFLLTFDMPIPFNAMGRRSVSNVPAQALTLMNDPFVAEQAALWAERILRHESLSNEEKIEQLFLAAFARRPEERERQQIESFLASEPDERRAWTDLCHALLNKKEFIYLN